MINDLSVFVGLACLVWASWQVAPSLGWASLGAALVLNGIGGFRRRIQEQKAGAKQ
jgi:hypothetical protein